MWFVCYLQVLLDFKFKEDKQRNPRWPLLACLCARLDTDLLAADYVSGKIQPSDILIFVESYNLLVIKSGMGGLRFSN